MKSAAKKGLSEYLLSKVNKKKDHLVDSLTPLQKTTCKVIDGSLVEYKEYYITSSSVLDMDEIMLKQILLLTEKNMKTIYEATSTGWDTKDKWLELTEDSAFYLTVTRKQRVEEVVAFVHYRFEMDDDDTVCILYCYEIQLEQDVQGAGLGKYLMGCLESIAKKYHMRSVVLTCQRVNDKAEQFYKQKLGYKKDWTDPNVDYVILSKNVGSLSFLNNCQ